MMKPLVTLTLLMTLMISLLTGCKELSPEAEQAGDKAHGDAAVDAGGEESASEDDAPEGDGAATAPHAAELPYMEVQIPVYNKDTLYGKLYDPWQKPAPVVTSEDEEDTGDEEAEPPKPSNQYPLVILLHGMNGSHRDWGTLPGKLVQAGYAVLALDLRGHQRSALRGRGWRSFTNDDWQKLVSDVSLVLSYFPNLENYPQVDKTRTVLIGSSIGANVAVLGGEKNPDYVKAIVLLSPGIDYKGLNIVKAVYRYKNPILMVASQNDLTSFESTQILYRIADGPKDLQLYRNIGHGTDMIRFYPQLQDKLVQWLKEVLPPTERPIVYPVEESDDEADSGDEEA